VAKSSKMLLLFITVSVVLGLSGCSSNPEKVTVKQVTELVRTYFQKTYAQDVAVKDVSYERVGQYNYLNNRINNKNSQN
jgi:uncharacterized lipoprotein YehR (DUF1307 family)